MLNIYILSHTDLDGFISAGLAQRFINSSHSEICSFKHKSWTYGRDIPNIDTIRKNYDMFVLVDLCLDDDSMNKLIDLFGKNFIWIDHHLGPDNLFIESLSKDRLKLFEHLNARREHANAACSLVWKYFTNNSKVPYWLKLISDFDCWNRSDENYWQNEVMPFFSYMKFKASTPEEAYDFIVNELDTRTKFAKNKEEYYCSDSIIAEELQIGKYMYLSTKQLYNADCKHGFAAELTVLVDRYNDSADNKKKLKAWICNTQNRSSLIFEDMPDKDEYDVFIPYHFNGKKFYYSMYTFKHGQIACNRIRVYYNDFSFIDFNGHVDAAGANSEEFFISTIDNKE